MRQKTGWWRREGYR